jgi:hypothetical protein
MLVTSTVSGVVVGKDSQQLTLLLQSGNKELVKYVETDLELGDKVLVAFNTYTGTVAALYNQYDILREGIQEVMPRAVNPLLGFDSEHDCFNEWECSREPVE